MIYCNCGAKFRSHESLQRHDFAAHMRRLNLTRLFKKVRFFGFGFMAGAMLSIIVYVFVC